MEEKLEIFETNKKSEESLHFYLIFCAFMDFYFDVVKRNIHVWFGCTKTGIPGLVLFCIVDLMYTFLTDPSLQGHNMTGRFEGRGN